MDGHIWRYGTGHLGDRDYDDHDDDGTILSEGRERNSSWAE
jgi:hypothetical protein